MSFYEHTNIFNLVAVLKDNKLTITLEDYVDWTIYCKKYTEDDVGKDIHKKMDLNDVYDSFARTQFKNDEESMI